MDNRSIFAHQQFEKTKETAATVLLSGVLEDDEEDALLEKLIHAAEAVEEEFGSRFIHIPPNKFVPVANPIRCVSDLPQNVLAVNGKPYQLRKHFAFDTPEELQEVMHKLGFASSPVDLHDVGVRFGHGNREWVGGCVAFLVYVKRFCFKSTDLEGVGIDFGLPYTAVSTIVSAVGDHLSEKFTARSFHVSRLAARCGPSISKFNQGIVERYEAAYLDRYHHPAPRIPPEISHTGLLIDGTMIEMRRPSEPMSDVQNAVYIATHGHAFGVLAFVAGDGLCVGVDGPHVGTSDLGMMRDGNIAHHLAGIGQWKVLGDSIFNDGPNIVHMPDTAESVARDRRELHIIQTVRSEIEHLFTFKVKYNFFRDKTKHTMTSKSYKHLVNCMFLENIWKCKHWSQTTLAFKCSPGNWEEHVDETERFNY
jgi:hypothetical protein